MLRYLTSGESHGLCLIAILEGMPAGLALKPAFIDADLRDSVKIMVGGAPVTQDFADDMGADGYGKDALACVAMAKRFMGVPA